MIHLYVLHWQEVMHLYHCFILRHTVFFFCISFVFLGLAWPQAGDLLPTSGLWFSEELWSFKDVVASSEFTVSRCNICERQTNSFKLYVIVHTSRWNSGMWRFFVTRFLVPCVAWKSSVHVVTMLPIIVWLNGLKHFHFLSFWNSYMTA